MAMKHYVNWSGPLLTNTDINNDVREIIVPQEKFYAARNKLFGTNVYASWPSLDPPIHPFCTQVHCALWAKQ